ncbi:hypothetical protein Chor_008111 [Crotalus horridus]
MNGHCYKVFEEQKNWKDAEMFCRKYKPGCHLASLHSIDDSADVAEYISDYLKSGSNVWIGLNDPKKTDPERATSLGNQESPTTMGMMNIALNFGTHQVIQSGMTRIVRPCVRSSASADSRTNGSSSCSRGTEAPGEEATKPTCLPKSLLCTPSLITVDFCSLDLISLIVMGQKKVK